MEKLPITKKFERNLRQIDDLIFDSTIKGKDLFALLINAINHI